MSDPDRPRRPRRRWLARAAAALFGVAVLTFAANSLICTTCPVPLLATPPQGDGRFKAEVWADNWFALYAETVLVGEDSVPVSTERSFNAETILFDGALPLTLNLIAKDYKENDTGLEYIGRPNQQIGDGGVIVQVTDTTTGRIIALTDEATKCLTIHRAPLRPECVRLTRPTIEACGATTVDEPAGWMSPRFDFARWPTATIYSEADVGTKGGYASIRWDARARLIWTDDLKLDNTILCRLTILAS